jgi:hypothetical protein
MKEKYPAVSNMETVEEREEKKTEGGVLHSHLVQTTTKTNPASQPNLTHTHNQTPNDQSHESLTQCVADDVASAVASVVFSATSVALVTAATLSEPAKLGCASRIEGGMNCVAPPIRIEVSWN